MKRTSVFVTLLILSGLLTACAATGTPTVDDIVERLQAAQEQQQDMHAVMEMTVTLPASDQPPLEMVVEEWVKGPDKMRMEYLEAPESMAGTVMVLDGRQMWLYNPADNTYTEMALPNLEELMPSSAEMATQTRVMVEQMLNTMDFTYLGTEQVIGRTTHKLRATPKPGQTEQSLFGMPATATLWVDAETWQVLKMEMDLGEMGQVAWVYREVEYNPEMSDDLFTFVPPEGAQRAEGPQMRMMTLEEARQVVNFPVLAPTEVPEGYELQMVQVMGPVGPASAASEAPRVMLMYQRGLATLGIIEAPASEALPQPPGAEQVMVRGHEGLLAEVGSAGRMLMWQENGVQITMTGQLSVEELLAVAESLQ